MIRNYIIIAWRNLLRNKFISLINIGGLAIGISTFMIIAIYVSYELSYDEQFENKDSIFRVTKQAISPYNPSGIADQTDAITKQVILPISGINKIARLYHHPSSAIPSAMVSFYNDQVDEKSSFEEFEIYKAEQEFLDMFQLPMIYGKRESALNELYQVVISKSTAIKYFGECSSNIIGKTLYIDQDHEMFDDAFTISGIFEDLPDNSHLQFDILISYLTYSTINPELFEHQTAHGRFHCYLQLNDPGNYKKIEHEVQQIMDSVYTLKEYLAVHGDNASTTYQKMTLQPLPSVYLDTPTKYEMKEHSKSSYLLILSGIAVIILVIAWINYINLSLVQLMRRTKETGIRKVIGANRGGIVSQFLIESLNANILAMLVSITLISLTIPVLAEFIGKPLNMAIWFMAQPDLTVFIIIFTAVFALSTMVTGLYPAIIFSNVSPSTILKGVASTRIGKSQSRNNLRSILIFTQYASVYILIALTIGFYLQIKHLQNSELGFDGSQVLVLPTPMKVQADFDKIEYLKEVLNTEDFVQHISMSSSVPGKPIFWSSYLGMIQQDSIKSPNKYISADENFLELYEMKLIAGRNFDPNNPSDQNAVIIEKGTLEFLGYTNPEDILGEGLGIGAQRTTDPFAARRVIGVIDDYHHTSPKTIVWPIAIIQEGGYLTREENGSRVIHTSFHSYDRSYLSLKINSDNIKESISQIEKSWATVFPGYAFDYFFQDYMYNQQYKADLKFGTIFLVFTIISISLACLGLLGICIFLINRRTKEIGIRKILGASIANLFRLMVYRFMGLILVAGIFGIPVTWYVLNQILQEFAIRIELSWWIFAVPLAFILIIALITIGGNTLRKVNANPVDALRYE